MHPKGALEGPGIRLGPREMDLLCRGIPELDLRGIPQARGLEPGLAAPLLDGRGRPAGAAVADPGRGVLRVWSCRPARAFDRAFFLSKVDAALSRRAPLRNSPDTDAFRLLHGDGDGLSGIVADAWGEFIALEALGEGPARWAGAVAEALAERLRPRGIVLKLSFSPGEGPGGARSPRQDLPLERGKVEERVLAGERPPDPLVVRESGIPFAVRLLGSRHAGLFTDMREERKRLRGLARGRRVLNAFAYTGSFSVAAVRGGAPAVTTVDIVGKVLEWAKENFRLSGIDPGLHHFARMDALEFLDMARRKSWSFDAIVLDPPTFATAGGSRWSLPRDYPKLIEKALRVLSPGGHLWVAANAAGVPAAEVDRWIEAGAAAAGRKPRIAARASQPIDYPAPEGFPRYRYLKIRIIQA